MANSKFIDIVEGFLLADKQMDSFVQNNSEDENPGGSASTRSGSWADDGTTVIVRFTRSTQQPPADDAKESGEDYFFPSEAATTSII